MGGASRLAGARGGRGPLSLGEGARTCSRYALRRVQPFSGLVVANARCLVSGPVMLRGKAPPEQEVRAFSQVTGACQPGRGTYDQGGNILVFGV